MLPFNTLHTSLDLTHIRLSVHLVFQSWNAELLSMQETILYVDLTLDPKSTVGTIRKKFAEDYANLGCTCYCVSYHGQNGHDQVGVSWAFHC